MEMETLHENMDRDGLKRTIAKLKKTVKALKRSNEALLEEKKILAGIIDNLPGTFYVWDDRTRPAPRSGKRDETGEYPKAYYNSMIGECEVFKYVLYRIEQIAPTDATVLVLGETGTGKELVTRAIHSCSNRKDSPLIKVDCASLPEALIESELFGHEKGAFTGAYEKRIGRFELADGATIFLDEIGELSLPLQQKLLRVLQEGEYERLGSSVERRTDARVIAATNRNLEEDVEKGRFRKDLWYRLNVFPLSIPPLRERTEDIPLLIDWMIKKNERKFGKRILSIPDDVIEELMAYRWPGNVRELENIIERSMIVTKGSVLELSSPLKPPPPVSNPESEMPVKTLVELEKEHILKTLEKTRWNVSGKGGAADLLGLNPSTLRGRMRKHGICRPNL